MSIRGLINRVLGRWVPPVGSGRSHDDWQAGDLAVCIDSTPWVNLLNGIEVPGPRKGDVVRVVAVDMRRGFHMLAFRGLCDRWFTAHSFQKIRPCKASFANLIRRHSQPRVDA